MKLALTCFSRSCAKPRFLDYYVCAEHFAFYAASRYGDSMAGEVGPITSSGTVEVMSCTSSQSECTAHQPWERGTTSEVKVA